VHVRLGPTGEVILDSVIKGDTVREVLNYVQFSTIAGGRCAATWRRRCAKAG
jgi:arginine decarboxylase-like protein